MKLTITHQAEEELQRIKDPAKPLLRLFYDTEGCGCGVNGLPSIRQESERRETDLEVQSTSFSTIIDNQQAIFFKNEMKLDFVKGSFRLSSPEGMLNPIISIKDVKEGATI
ncbi:iron-sulfur cluster biosynthesis family protein [Halobacillus rhizosphaerae]|uniref:iron-sulfur cluster biosynthesis family protein n=1 Tax=Halobacillus rhizosphaerae TaxID=3064889 RepID=UPI00398A8020